MLISKILIKSLEQCQFVPDEELVLVELVDVARYSVGWERPGEVLCWKQSPEQQPGSPSTNLVWVSFLVLHLFAYCVSLSTHLNLKWEIFLCVHNICVSSPFWCALRVVKACKSQQCVVQLSAAHRRAGCLGDPPGEKEYGHCAPVLRDLVRKWVCSPFSSPNRWFIGNPVDL